MYNVFSVNLPCYPYFFLPYNPYFFTSFSKSLSIPFPYFLAEGHIKSLLIWSYVCLRCQGCIFIFSMHLFYRLSHHAPLLRLSATKQCMICPGHQHFVFELGGKLTGKLPITQVVLRPMVHYKDLHITIHAISCGLNSVR